MGNLTDRIFDFFKKEIILSISAILAIISCFFVPPNANYFNYINWDTIILLLVIMIVVEVLKNLSVFEMMVRKLLTKVKKYSRACSPFDIYLLFKFNIHNQRCFPDYIRSLCNIGLKESQSYGFDYIYCFNADNSG